MCLEMPLNSCRYHGKNVKSRLMKEKKRIKNKGGRPKIADEDYRKRFSFYLKSSEKNALIEQQQRLGYSSLGEYLRFLCLNNNKKIVVANPIELLKRIDKIGGELNKIGNNINQIAKYANQYSMISKYDKSLIEQFNDQFYEYKKLKSEMIKAYKDLLKNV